MNDELWKLRNRFFMRQCSVSLENFILQILSLEKANVVVLANCIPFNVVASQLVYQLLKVMQK